ncbi:hypothetical protein BGX24_005230, partial [Mortierella sp. AD032]
YYVFGGERQGSTFFGGIYGVNNVLKMFTTEKHLPQRIARRLKIRKLDSLEQYQQNLTQEKAQRILEGSLSAFGMMLAVGLLVWWGWRRRRQTGKRKEISAGEQVQEGEEQVQVADDEYPSDKENRNHLDEEEGDHSLSEGKFEVYSGGIILEDESTPDHSKSLSDTEITAWTRPQLEGKILSDVHLQDHNRVRELVLSKHPRPTIVTSVCSPNANADIKAKKGRS